MAGSKREQRKRQHELEQTAMEISELRSSLDEAYSHFNHTTEPGAVDACVFEINALRARYNTALKHYRERYY